MYDVYENKPLSLVVLKTSSYVKTYNDGTKWMCYLIEDDGWIIKKNIMIFWIKLVTVWKKNLISNPYIMKKFLETKIKSYSDETTDFHNKTCL